ncbi:PucR family transcriptional regulator [Gordonia sp. TBRC 11910]|uniref:PucR family transcriptional regulator n=1 Tax=Gordonia asplenii TaxID=2725283 RepID=A0A848L1T9_9ACTN|nr:PucR family transcriptional regulator [Gordonia asplenii]NMO04679.1 PucR family transcriptional regulator [Gordonia asplenii]
MEPPECTPAVKDLIRQAAQQALDAPQSWFDEIDEAAFSASDMERIADDPALRAFTVRSTHALLRYWAAANVADPGAYVPPLVDDLTSTAQSMVYRGHTEANVDAYRLGQNVAWRRWMKIAFALTSNIDDLRDMLDVTAQTIGTFVDATISALTAEIASERDRMTRGREAARLDAVSGLIAGGRVDRASAELIPGYRLDQVHTAIVVWTTDPSPRLSELERTVDDLAKHLGAAGVVRIVASAGTVWGWLGGVTQDRLRDVGRIVDARTDWQIAIGSTGPGLDGFRTSHLDAVRTQHMMARLDTDHSVGTFADVEGVLLLAASPDQANRFVAHTLGPLETGYPELREAVRAYLAEQCNASKAADRLFTHRNTLLRRIKRADELLPRTVADNALNIGMALEIRHWRGATSTAD